MELIVVVAVFTIVGALVAQAFRNVRTHTQLIDRAVSAEQDARAAMEALVALLSGASPRGLEVLPDGSGSELRVRLPERDAGGHLVLTAFADGPPAARLEGTRTVVAADPPYLVVERLTEKGVVSGSRVLCTTLAPNEDANGNGTLDTGEETLRDGRLQYGLRLRVEDEDLDGDNHVDPGEDANRNGRRDCVVTIQIDTLVPDPRGRDHGRATLATRVYLRND